MPTYEYACTACDNHWEEVQKISADPLEVCPKCAQTTAKRQISGGNFILKGGGWYADLYSSQPKAKSGGEGKSEGGKADGASAPAAAPTKSEGGGAASPAASSGSGGGASSGSSGGSSGGGGSSGASSGGSSSGGGSAAGSSGTKT